MKKPKFSNQDVEILAQKQLQTGFLPINEYRLKHATFNASISEPIVREVMEKRDAVAVLVYDPQAEKIALIEQFRPGALKDAKTPWLFEIVAGLIEDGESLEQVAAREVFEETGIEVDATNLQKIHSFYTSPGGTSEYVTLFAAAVSLQNCDDAGQVFGLKTAVEFEDIQRHVMSFDDVFAMLKAGQIKNAISLIALQWLLLESRN